MRFAALCLLLAWTVRADSGTFDIRAYGARDDGKTDCTQALQRAIDAASVRGGVVQVPVGRWLCRGHLNLRMGVHLEGMNRTPQSWEPASGSMILPTEGRDHEDAAPFIRMNSSTSVSGLTIYYPEQKTDDIRPYPWTIQIDAGEGANATSGHPVSFDATVENVLLVNSYNGIRTGPHENGRHRIVGVQGCVLRRGILVDWTGDVGRIEDVHFHSHFWAADAYGGNWNRVFTYMQNNLEAFIFGRTDWEYVTNTFVFPAKIGYRFIETKQGACNGQFSGIGADATQTAVLVESVQPEGLLITNGEFNSHLTGPATQVIVEKECKGSVRFVNCGFWGPVAHNAMLRGSGYTSFQSCYFSNDQQTSEYALEADAGRLQVENCTFDARSKERKPGNAAPQEEKPFQPPSIHVGAGVRSAIITGNNGYRGVSVTNDAGNRTMMRDNEAPAKESDVSPD
jgi:hypothetical protein